MSNRLSRRGFVALLTGFVAAAGVSCSRLLNGLFKEDVTAVPTQTPTGLRVTSEPDPTKISDEPLPTEEPVGVGGEDPEATLPPKKKADFGPRVVHVHASSATSWNGSDPQYWNYIDQNVVNDMIDRGVMELSGALSVADAWRAILPNYQPGQGIAIKVSFNNCFTCGNPGTAIDGVIEPVNAVVRGLLQIGVLESDVWIYDAIRALPDRFVDGCLYKNVQFFDNGCYNPAGWKSKDPDAFIAFNVPTDTPSPPPIRVTDVLINASYLINVPIMKKHIEEIGVSLAFKNHFGSITNPGDLHEYIRFDSPIYRTDYSALVDLVRNPHIFGKTILTVGDGLFASKIFNQSPSFWTSFNNDVPNSLFFSTDPVAIDCVMMDHLVAEMPMPKQADDYLRVASNANLGVYERGDPWSYTYKNITYQKLEL